MRFARTASLALLALTLVATAARADDSNQLRVFNSGNCPKPFACSGESTDLAALASSCAREGMGMSVSFDNSSTDSDGCLTADVGGSGSHASQVKCCAIPSQDACIMRCAFLTN